MCRGPKRMRSGRLLESQLAFSKGMFTDRVSFPFTHPSYQSRLLRPTQCLVSGKASTLDAFRSYPYGAWLPGNAFTTGTLEAPFPRSSRIMGNLSSGTNTFSRSYRTVSRRTERISRGFLTGGQPDHWRLMHHQDNPRPYRCIKPRGRCGRSPATNRLPLE